MVFSPDMSSETSRRVKVSVPEVTVEDGTAFYLITADVVNGTIETSTISRRFKQFNDLYDSLTKKFGSSNVPSFPGKT